MKNIQIKIATVKLWTTHMTMLMKVLQHSRGTVLELGGGQFSTPLLHWICKEQGRKLITYESDPDYYKLCKGFQSGLHRVRFIENWDDVPLDNYGVVFVDHHPDTRRVVDLIRFKDKADFIVCHDTEKREKYGWDQADEHFKHQYVWKECKPWTSVYSKNHDLYFLY